MVVFLRWIKIAFAVFKILVLCLCPFNQCLGDKHVYKQKLLLLFHQHPDMCWQLPDTHLPPQRWLQFSDACTCTAPCHTKEEAMGVFCLKTDGTPWVIGVNLLWNPLH